MQTTFECVVEDTAEIRAGLEALCRAAYDFWTEASKEWNRRSLGLSHAYTDEENRALVQACNLANDAWRGWCDINRVARQMLGLPNFL